MLEKRIRINKGKEYKNIYKNGKRIAGKHIIVYIRRNDLGFNRFGIVTSKKIGNAVKRNSVKRQIRAIIKKNLPGLDGSNDIVIVSRQNTREAFFDFLERDFLIVMRKAGLC